MKLFTRDWLDSKELRRCSPAARGFLTDLMCLAHEGKPYGFLADDAGKLTHRFVRHRCQIESRMAVRLYTELHSFGRIKTDENGTMYIPQMVEDAALRAERSSNGAKGGNPKLVNHQVQPMRQPPSDSDAVSVSGFLNSSTGQRARETTTTTPASTPVPVPVLPSVYQTEWPLTTAAIRDHDLAVDDIFVRRLADATAQRLISAGDMETFDDEDLAFAVRKSYAEYTGRGNHGTGLLLMRVPQILLALGENGNGEQNKAI